LVVASEGLRLQTAAGLAISVDFTEAKYQRRFAPGKDLLCRACGWHLGLRELWDLTAGLGADAMLLAQAGFKVRAFERNKYLVVLLKQALRQLQQDPSLAAHLRGSLEFSYAESAEMLALQTPPPEVIYYDPMYPAQRKTALPSKELQVLRELNGSSGEDLELVEQALRWGPRRFVVKRPHRAPPVKGKPSSEVSGKLVRFDLYLGRKS
jgi:16S rRNA (guanine1516-N2)-methyltransferase